MDLGAVLSLWRTPSEDRRSWSRAPEVYRRLGERILKLGEPLLAYDRERAQTQSAFVLKDAIGQLINSSSSGGGSKSSDGTSGGSQAAAGGNPFPSVNEASTSKAGNCNCLNNQRSKKK